MQSTHKIAGADAQGFADYLTADAGRGDYYVPGEYDPAGEDRAAGVWHGSPSALASLGLSAERPVQRDQLLALMNGQAPNDGREIRAVGGNGTRVAGIDMTFSAPKSVSALWAASSGEDRELIEHAHREAVESAIGHVERNVELVRTREQGELKWQRANSLVAAQFMHTSSRLTRDQERGGVPDPQLHTHVVVLAAERGDGSFAAVDSREVFRSARMNGAWYRSQLAHNLKAQGLQIERNTGKDGRYFEVRGVPGDLAERWSTRTAQIEQAAREFRDRYGRDPKGAELGSLTTGTRGTKTLMAQVNVDHAWKAVAGEYGLTRDQAHSLFAARGQTSEHVQQTGVAPDLGRELVARVSANSSTVSERDLYAIAYERSTVATRGANEREVNVNTSEFNDVKLAYAQHVYKAQGLTTDRALTMIGGWQTDRERAYVAVTRAREQTNIYVAREDLGQQGIDTEAIERLAERIAQSHAPQASIAREPATDRVLDPTTDRALAQAPDVEPEKELRPDPERTAEHDGVGPDPSPSSDERETIEITQEQQLQERDLDQDRGFGIE